MTDGETSTFTVTNGKDGKDGVSVTSVKQTTTSAEDSGNNVITVTLSDGQTSTFTVKNGSKGSKGDTGEKGEQGIQGVQGIQGEKGEKGADGSDYVLTDTDKEEIAELVSLVKAPQEPDFANGTSEMTDTSKVYVNTQTGTFWVNKEATIIKEIKETADVDYEYPENSRLGSDGTVQTSGSYAGYTITPFIDLLAYSVPFTLHLEGMVITPTATDSYTRVMVYNESQTKVSGANTIVGGIDTVLNVSDSNVTVYDDGSTSILFETTPKAISGGNSIDCRYVRFSGKITTTPSVYVTYEREVTEATWIDTGISYAPNITEEEKQQIANDIVSRIDTELLSVVGSGEVV